MPRTDTPEKRSGVPEEDALVGTRLERDQAFLRRMCSEDGRAGEERTLLSRTGSEYDALWGGPKETRQTRTQ